MKTFYSAGCLAFLSLSAANETQARFDTLRFIWTIFFGVLISFNLHTLKQNIIEI